MIGSRRGRSRAAAIDIWPGFVDALASLLMVVIFLLMVFVLAQVFLSDALSGRDDQIARLNRQLAELGDMLALERQSNTEYRQTVQQLSLELQTTAAARDELQERLNAAIAQVESATSTADSLRTKLAEATRVTETGRAPCRERVCQ